MASITLGVGALVAIHSFRADVTRSVRTESRSLLGADLRLQRNRAFPDSVDQIVDSVEEAGARVSRVTTLLSMVYARSSDLTRLLQLKAVEEGYPFYGDVATDPAGHWGGGLGSDEAVVDPAVLIQLGVVVGDSLRIGDRSFRVAATVEGLPTEVGFQTAVGPRVFIRATELASTGLLGFGSLARYQVFLRLPGSGEAEALQTRYRQTFRTNAVDSDTSQELARNLTRGMDTLSRFLGLVGLVALLLGGIGVASAIHVYVQERLDSVAVLRCIGATGRDVFLSYLLQTGTLGLLGGGAGAVLGIGVQLLLPRLLAGVLPVEVTSSLHPVAILAGLAAGVWIAGIFALLPLLGLRDASPLQALRRDFGFEPRGRDPLRLAAYGALGASVLLVCVWQAPDPAVGASFAVGLAVILGLLGLTARGLAAAMRRFFPRKAAYPERHGAANLFRPRNQTAAITLALGFGVFLVAAVGQVRGSLVDRFDVERGSAGRPNLLLFDIQPDERAGVDSTLRAASGTPVSVTPIVPAEIAAVKGRPVSELLQDRGPDVPRRWVLNRMYRNTYRDSLTDAETLVDGRWWERRREGAGRALGTPGNPARISLEADLASDLHVGVGDSIAWDVQGTRIESVVASLRTVDWTRFEPNFFVVFEPGVLDRAPRTFVALARVPGEETRARLQGSLVRRFPGVSILDLARVQETLDSILDRATEAVRFLAGFSGAAGLLVLLGALATSRFQRTREGALLRTLGARRGQMIRIVLSEYLSLGLVAGGAGAIMGAVGGWLVVSRLFDLEFHLRPWPLLAVWVGTAVLTGVVGVASSRRILRTPPLVVLRETLE